MTETQKDRDERGLFAPGNQIGKGRSSPICAPVVKLRQAFLSVITTEEMADVTRGLLDLCKNAEGKVRVQAIELLLNRLFGKPRETVDVAVTQSPLDPGAYTDDQLALVLDVLANPAKRPPVIVLEATPTEDSE